ncbi:putative disease resistance protein RGA4 [Phragmites australis]|uniref:putative disease resistance protein RGA4 n=1 Tax=Phragmites australis TaxID=29695 RepID=UPI002D794869|nr:putative disease resistance protein RGA4 [Phragmites australis]
MAELVTTMLVTPLVTMVKQKASSYLLDQYNVMQGMEDQREILGRRLPAILDVIEDAEKVASRPGVSAWLQALKKVSYEAIDIFDEFKYEALRRDAKKKGHYNKLGMDVVSLFPAHNPIMFRYRMGKKLRKIVQDIEVLVKDMNDFGFTQRHQVPPSMQWRQTDSTMVDSEKGIVSRSREEEKKKIMKILLEQDGNGDLMVLPIIGMGGLGKTTFVQLIYNDPQIEKHFSLRVWCCVSEDFDIGNIARNICHSHEQDRERALQDLQKQVSGKRYLIVLDDVWNRDADKWGKLITCLKQGDRGSAILTTTRDAEVARVMSMGVPGAYNLENLGNQYMKEIIQSRAFSVQKPDSDELDVIVDKIVDRCVGSPLAAKAFGSMLSTKTSLQEWKDVLAKSNICNAKTKIFPILKLSYDDLPSHMKQCFAFCAIFPKDYDIDVEDLIQLWMAHDFIPAQQEDNPDMVGKEIFNELVWRSFFQDVKRTPPLIDRQTRRKRLRYRITCKIHDLMHDVALSIMGTECTTIVDRPNDKKLWSNPTRHLFISYQETRTLLDDFLKKQSPTLRTVLYSHQYIYGSTPHLSKYNSLRAMQLCRLRKLPIRPRHLHHLRYLNLSGNWWIKELPREISGLYNLLTMELSDCRSLCRLPNDMKYMRSLRHLYTSGCKSLKSMPTGLGQLTSLQTLTYFVVGSSSGCSSIGELQNMNLGGELELRGLENVTEAHAKAASLGNKEKLTHLSLEWNSKGHEESVQDSHEKVLDSLKPHHGLEIIRIVNYKGSSVPTWMKDLGFLQQHLTELHLVGCTMCEEFPEFSHLRALQVLHLIKLYKLQSLCSDMAFMEFPALKELQLHDLESLERWVATEGNRELTFPVLETVDIINCPKLTSLPKAPKIKVIKLEEEKAQLSLLLITSRYMSSLSSLKLSVSDKEATLELDQNYELSISKMEIADCSFLFTSSPLQQIVGIWKWFGQLQVLKIISCDALIYWPEEEFLSLVSLKELVINLCSKLIGRAQVNGVPTQASDQLLPQLKKLEINCCNSLTELFILPPSITHIEIDGCDSFRFIWGKEDTESMSVEVEHGSDLKTRSEPEQLPRNNSLPCLETLFIRGSHKLATLPNLPPSLRCLKIYHCPELLSISGQLHALVKVSIGICNKLETPDWGNLPALEHLGLISCKRLTSLPGSLGSYSALIRVHVKYCPAINMKPLYEHLPQRLDHLEYRLLSYAHSSDPCEGPKIGDPQSWQYAIPGCQEWTTRRHMNL